MKILYHHRTRSKDGQTVHIDEVVDALRALGHEVIVVAPPAMQQSAFGSDAGMVAAIKRALPQAVYEFLELGYNVVAFLRLRRRYLTFKPDLLYERYNLFLLAGAWLKRLYGVPFFVEVNAPLAEERRLFEGLALTAVAGWAEKSVWLAADRTFPVTHVLAGHVRRAGVREDRITVAPNGISEAFLRSNVIERGLRRRLGLAGRIVVGFVGFMRDWHGLEQAVDAIADSDPSLGLHLLLIGDGPALPNLHRRAVERGVDRRVTFAGLIQREDLPEYIATFDIALQPRVNPYASPLKIFEYMSMGRAIVAPDTPNVREILADGATAILFDPDRDAALREAIVRLSRDPAFRSRLGEAATAEVLKRDLTWTGNACRIVAQFDILTPPFIGSRSAGATNAAFGLRGEGVG